MREQVKVVFEESPIFLKNPAQECFSVGCGSEAISMPADSLDGGTEFRVETYEPSGKTLRKIAEFIKIERTERNDPVIVITGSGKIGAYALTSLQIELPI